MFNFFKKKAIPTEAELESLAESALQETVVKWREFNGKIHLKGDNQLAEKIDFFSQAVHEYFQKKYPIIVTGPSKMFWSIIFTAVAESGTHRPDEVNDAIDFLSNKYGR